MSKFDKYMTDKTVENRLSDEEKKAIIENAEFAIAISKLEGDSFTDDENDYFVFCKKNNIPEHVFFNHLLIERGLTPLSDEQLQRAREARDNNQYQGTVKL